MIDPAQIIKTFLKNNPNHPLIIAIEGRCAAGKTTLALKLQEEFHCQIIHMDDFFLQKHQRTKQRLQEIGGNVDYERFLNEVMIPLKKGQPFTYRKFDCHTMQFSDNVKMIPQQLTIIEGSYSCHPTLWDNYDIRFFLNIDSNKQLQRIHKRNGAETLKVFQTRWIPLEEQYFLEYHIMEKCDYILGGDNDMKAKVYFSRTISPEKVLELYQLLDKTLPGKVAVKLHSGEKGNQNFLKPEFFKPMIEYVDGTVVECNTAYDGERNTTEKHKKLIEYHGWNKYFHVDLLDAKGPDLKLEYQKGKVIQENYVGKNIVNYDSMLVLSHFKGHPMGGYGGALKQLSIGVASSYGKAYIHGAGVPENIWSADHDLFLESMADAAGSIVDYFKGNIVYINVMKNMSVDCDCCAKAEDPCLNDIGILISTDPIAIDQACIDLVYQCDDKGRDHFIERVESRHGIHTIEAAADLGYGSRDYELIEV